MNHHFELDVQQQDYDGDITKVIDPVRGSGMFDNIEGYTRAVEILVEGGQDVPEILRFKDRVTKPIANGCGCF